MRQRAVVVSVQGRPGLPEDQVSALEAIADVRHIATHGGRLPQDEAMRALADADVVGLTPKVMPHLDERLLDALPRLRAIALYATGYDMVDVTLLERRGIALAYLPDYSSQSVAEHALGLMLSLSRRIHLGHDRSRGLVPPGTSLRGFELSGRTLGIVGLGRIGSRVANLGRAFGMQVLATDIRRVHRAGVDVVGADELWQRSDIVSLNCSTTWHAPPVVTARELALMAPGSVLVNVSRASLVDRSAVVQAVRSGRLRGYAVDDVVFGAGEADLLTEGRILQTGHVAWWSDEVLTRGARAWIDVIHALVLGHEVPRARSSEPDVVLDLTDPEPVPVGTPTGSAVAVADGEMVA